jgi:predicted Zn-dependent peptidase
MERGKIKIGGITLLYEKRNIPITSVALAFKVGSIKENERIKGISHFVEHMLFKGTKKRSQKEIAYGIEKLGGELNGFTSQEVTAYHTKIPSKNFSKAFEILADLVQNPAFLEKEIEKERKVILEEIKMNHDNPKRFLYKKVFQCLYAKPFGLPIIGDYKSLKNIDRKRLVFWHNANYSTNNMLVSIVGKNEIEEVMECIKENIKIRNRKVMENLKPKKICKNFYEKRKDIKQAHLAFSFHLPTSFKHTYTCEILNTVVGHGMSSWLFQEIREKRGLAYSTHSEIDLGKDYGYFMIYVGTSKEKVKECEKIVLDIIKRMKEIDRKEFEEAKEQVIGNFYLKRENSLETCFQLIDYEMKNKYREYYSFEEKIKEVKKEKVKEIFKEFVGVSKVFVLPKNV